MKPKRRGGGKQYWTKERCFDEARKYSTKVEFMKGCLGAYRASHQRGWIDEVCSHMHRPIKWNREECQKEAVKFKHRVDFAKSNPSAYNAARKNGWLDGICGHMLPKANVMMRHVYEIADHERKVVYVGLTYDLKKREWSHRRKNKKITDNFPEGFVLHPVFKNLDQDTAKTRETELVNMYRNMGYTVLNSVKPGGLGASQRQWTKEACLIEAGKYDKRADFIRYSRTAYSVARQMGWLDEVCANLAWSRVPDGYWTKDRIWDEAKRFESMKDFILSASAAYAALRRDKPLELKVRDFFGRIRMPRGYWTFDRVSESASRRKNFKDFRKNDTAAYSAASRNGWVKTLKEIYGW